jgi:UDP-glucose 4-epimerase
MTILVTGSSGYIGSRFIQNYSTDYSFEFFSLQTSSLESINFSKIDAIVHCAALVHQKNSYSQKEYDTINADYPYQLAKKAKENGVRHFLFISTVAVYQESPLINETSPCSPTTPYGLSKLKAEKLLQSLSDENFVVSILRSPMVYGPDAPGNIAALSKLVRMLPILPFGGIKNSRTFVGINNLIALIDALLKKRLNGVFLAADDASLSTTHLIRLIAAALNKKVYLIKLLFFETLLKNIKPSLYNKLYGNLVVDNADTKKQLDFYNPYTTEEGIMTMFRNEYVCI